MASIQCEFKIRIIIALFTCFIVGLVLSLIFFLIGLILDKVYPSCTVSNYCDI
jgi:hypothetical protein